jgi:hypothetical protein
MHEASEVWVMSGRPWLDCTRANMPGRVLRSAPAPRAPVSETPEWPAAGGLEPSFLGGADLVADKRATGRAEDLFDLELLAERTEDRDTGA